MKLLGTAAETLAWHLGLPVGLVPAAGTLLAGTELRGYRTAHRAVLDRLPAAGETARIRWLRVVRATGVPAEAVRAAARDGVELAEAIRMGTIMVPLDNHAVIGYGVHAGLLDLQDHGEPDGLVRAVFDGPDTFRVGCRIGAAPGVDPADAAGAGTGHRAIYGWYLGMPAVHHVTLPEYYGGTAPSTPPPDLPGLRCYLTAPVDEQAPSSPERRVPTAGGTRILLPHHNTTDVLPGPRPHNAFGFFVVRGPKGSEATVRVGPAVPDSLPDAPLAAAILLHDRWAGLSNHLVIEYGVATGLLQLVPMEYGGQITTSFPDRPQLTVECTPTNTTAPGELGRVTRGVMDINRAPRPNSPAAPGARRIQVAARSFAFSPGELRVKAGEPVAIELTAIDVMHNLAIDEFGAFVQAEPGRPALGGFRADRPGTFDFYCADSVHRAFGMQGRLVVEP